MLDNISSNDVCVRKILTKLQPNLDLEKYRLCCFGHIVNLAAKAFLFRKDPESFEVEADLYIRLQQEEKELNAWRRLGPIGKLHNVVVYIQKNPQWREAFLSLSNGEDIDAVLKISSRLQRISVKSLVAQWSEHLS